jgi:signal transduction histidine kinase
MIEIHRFFLVNRPLLMFVYGLTFFTMGLAIFLQSRRYSRLRLARDLRWMAAFGVLHGIYEWGDVFIPIQNSYLPMPYVQMLYVFHALLLAVSFLCLLMFGVVSIDRLWPHGAKFAFGVAALWGIMFWLTLQVVPNFDLWRRSALIWARYLLGFPGSLLAAYGLRYQAKKDIDPLASANISRVLRVAWLSLAAYAVLAGAIVAPDNFFPANIFNRDNFEAFLGVPIEVFRSLVGLILAVSMIRALEVFEIEVDQWIESMEAERIQAAERERIGQEIHDGAIQGIYSASLILESAKHHLDDSPQLEVRLDRANRVLSGVLTDLRQYMISLRQGVTDESLAVGLRRLSNDPRFSSLLHIQLKADVDPQIKPTQVGHALAIVQESLSNAIRHANASRVTIKLSHEPDSLRLCIEDDGQGFDEQKITPGFGLRTIRDRARLIGGKLDIQSRPGKGARITLTIPEENFA